MPSVPRYGEPAVLVQEVTARGRYYPHQWPQGAAQGIIEFFDLLVR
jgi:hypothetical protein